MSFKPWFVMAAVLVANCGFWLFCFNQINATGLPRRFTKRIEKLFIALCFCLPVFLLFADWPALVDWLTKSNSWWPTQTIWFGPYAAACLVSGIFLGGAWLESRLWLIPPKYLLSTHAENFNVHRSIAGGSPADNGTKLLCALPGNEIGLLQSNMKRLLIPRHVVGIEGLRIGHLSDIHLTGQYHQSHHEFVFDRLMQQEPDLIIVSGDIIDYDRCMSSVAPLFSRLRAPLGCYFVLGNHDCRLSDIKPLVETLRNLGFHDLGAQPQLLKLDNGSCLQLIGNERPWLERHSSHRECGQEGSCGLDLQSQPDERTLRVAVSHSPDQIPWARKCHCDLMLAGHTHGGQVRFPGVGPIVAPSHFGSRFASGVFFLAPTLVHVSRGIAGTHPIRFRCKPEVSVLVLSSDSDA